MRKARWRWMGHVLRKGVNEPCRVALEFEVEGNRGSGRPREDGWLGPERPTPGQPVVSEEEDEEHELSRQLQSSFVWNLLPDHCVVRGRNFRVISSEVGAPS